MQQFNETPQTLDNFDHYIVTTYAIRPGHAQISEAARAFNIRVETAKRIVSDLVAKGALYSNERDAFTQRALLPFKAKMWAHRIKKRYE